MLSRTFILAALAFSTSTISKPIEKRGAVLTGQWDTEDQLDGTYTLYNNLWGMDSADSGNQTTQATSASGTSVAWETTWTWSGASSQVKSYANLGINDNLGKILSDVQSIPSTWDWSYTNAENVVADVSYDLWLSSTPDEGTANAQSTYEIMIWLSSRGGAGPVGSQIATADIAGTSWALHQGTVSNWEVFSFIAPEEITNFDADLNEFFKYLIQNNGLDASNNYLTGGGAGTEPFTGSATLTTSAISIVIN